MTITMVVTMMTVLANLTVMILIIMMTVRTVISVFMTLIKRMTTLYELKHDIHGSDGCGEFCVSHSDANADVSSLDENRGRDVIRIDVIRPGPIWTSRLLRWKLVLWALLTRDQSGGGGGG